MDRTTETSATRQLQHQRVLSTSLARERTERFPVLLAELQPLVSSRFQPIPPGQRALRSRRPRGHQSTSEEQNARGSEGLRPSVLEAFLQRAGRHRKDRPADRTGREETPTKTRGSSHSGEETAAVQRSVLRAETSISLEHQHGVHRRRGSISPLQLLQARPG